VGVRINSWHFTHGLRRGLESLRRFAAILNPMLPPWLNS
jgi:hypothetical protein